MKKIFLFVLGFISILSSIKAQNFDTSKTALIEVSLTNKAKSPLTQEEIILVSNDKKVVHKLITNEKGYASITSKTNVTYTIIFKTIADSFTYGTLEIPGISANQTYRTPFKLDMIFEPAKSYTFHNLEFDVNKSIIKSSSIAELEMLVDYLKRKKVVKLKISGHTDSDGNEKANLLLSQQRAAAVKSFLIKKGISAARLSSEGFGATKPIADNETAVGKQQNRRTEIEFAD